MEKCRPKTEADLPEGEKLDETADKWSNMLFYVKWRRWAYKHCTWDGLNTLSQLGGYKRVLNYCKRMDEQEACPALLFTLNDFYYKTIPWPLMFVRALNQVVDWFVASRR